jgi:glycosyltransferase involved in cell wall biosynthesis
VRPSNKFPQGITIGIRNWNHEYLLGRSVGSALRAVADLKRHSVPAEVLVIDDGSRDGSSTLLRQLEALYFENSLRVYLSRTNSSSMGETFIRLTTYARYRYLFILDADDELIPSSLHLLYRAILQTGAAIAYGNIIRIEDAVSDGQDGTWLFSNQSYQDSLWHENYICATSLVDLYQVIDAGNYSDLLHRDWEMLLHLGAVGRLVIFVPVTTAYYYNLPNSSVKLSSKSVVEKQAERIYNQLGIRINHLLKTRHLVFHPDIGYLK